MPKTRIFVGSTRRPKLAAVEAALRDFGSVLAPGSDFEVSGAEVESGVANTPATRGELMQGARQRAEALILLPREKAESPHYFVGLEGGLDVIADLGVRRVFLETWAYVSDGQRGYYGRSGAVEVPEALAREVLENGVDLSVAIDRFAGATGIRDNQGAWGVLTKNIITREDSAKLAVITAFAPFVNETTSHQGAKSVATKAGNSATNNRP